MAISAPLAPANASVPAPSRAQAGQSTKLDERKGGSTRGAATERFKHSKSAPHRDSLGAPIPPIEDLGNRNPSVHSGRRYVRVRIALKNEPGIVVAGIGEDGPLRRTTVSAFSPELASCASC